MISHSRNINRPTSTHNAMRFLPHWITLPILVFLYKPLTKLFPRMDKDRYVRQVVTVGNAFFFRKFAAVPFRERMLFLPYCLRARTCPTIIDPDKGLQCPPQCPLECEVKHLKKIALETGYKEVFVVVSGRLHKREGILRSRDFLARQIESLKPKAVIGCLCAKDLRQKYLSPKNLSPAGTLGSMGHKVLPQIILLDGANCRKSSVDLHRLEELIRVGG